MAFADWAKSIAGLDVLAHHCTRLGAAIQAYSATFRAPRRRPYALVAHCGRWHRVSTIPAVLPCCSALLQYTQEPL